jgi:hypothetical protein
MCTLLLKGQTDKVFMKSGESKKGIIISIGKDFLFFKNSDTSVVQRINKREVVLVEKYDGRIFTFAHPEETRDSVKTIRVRYRNSFTVQPFNVLLGRMTGSYEFLTSDGKIGFVLPLSITFDPVGVFYSAKKDSNNVQKHVSGFNFIGGADVNFYVGKGDFEGLYLGPRIRYGTDMFINAEAYSVQTQFGWRIGDPEDRLIHHISVGFGFVRILSSPAGKLINPRQSYAWGSINYKIGLTW